MDSDDERRARDEGPAFLMKSQLMTGDDVARALRRMAHEILERDRDVATLSIIGLQTGGVPLAERLATVLGDVAGEAPRTGVLDVSFYRDDLAINPLPHSSETQIDHDLTGRTVLLVDDVLFTGRTIRAALNALTDWGRPRCVRLAVLVDRGHRELPIRPDFVGKNLPTSVDEAIVASVDGVWIGTRGQR